MIRTRFAPSPTGFLHIGGVRTAFFNYLYAKNQKGIFLLRIEDTDRERSRPEYEADILKSLKWLGLDFAEPPMRQSERLEHYRALAHDLVKRGLAYEEKKEGQSAIKFKMPETHSRFTDLVRGPVQFDTSLFDDLVILKSDGYPTYHLACVADDYQMQITHVIRGEDHLSNTPRQILLFEAFGWKPPKYAHLPLILGDDGAPLSKRHMKVSLAAYQEEGFLPEGLLNYLALLGWGSDANQEFFRVEDLVNKFSLKRITKAGARFNREKLEWINAEHMKRMSDSDFIEKLTVYFKEEADQMNPSVWQRFVLLYKTRLKTFSDLKIQGDYFFKDIECYDQSTRDAFFENKKLSDNLGRWVEKINGLTDFEDVKQVEGMTRQVADENQVKAKDLIHPLRFSVTGKTVSPGLFEVMRILGKEKCLERVRGFVNSRAV